MLKEFISADVDVVGVIDLNHASGDLAKLRSELMSLRRDYYSPNQTIVVQYTEQDYFYHDSPIGFCIHNFLRILQDVDISLGQITFVTTHNHIKESIRPFVSHENDMPQVHTVLVSRMTYNNVKDIVMDPLPIEKDIKYVGLCMLGTVREHRLRLYQYLKHNNLLDIIKTSFNNKKNPMLSKKPEPDCVVDVNSRLAELDLVYSFPPRSNEFWCKPIVNQEIEKISHVDISYDTSQSIIPASGYSFYREFALDVITETNFHYPSQFVSEKTLKPLLLKTPFLVFGPAGFLRYLQDHGFQTFGDLWNEEYDNVKDPQDRFVKCCSVLKDLAGVSITEWNNIYQKINNRLDHNRDLLLQYINNDFLQIHTKYKL